MVWSFCCCWRGGRGMRSEMIPWRTCLLPPAPYERGEETSRWYQLNSCSPDGLPTPLLLKQAVTVCLETLPFGNKTAMAQAAHCPDLPGLQQASPCSLTGMAGYHGLWQHSEVGLDLCLLWNLIQEGQMPTGKAELTLVLPHIYSLLINILKLVSTDSLLFAFPWFFFSGVGKWCSQRSKCMCCWWTL